MNKLLSIQIPFTDDRKDDFEELFSEFSRQIDVYGLENLVEVIWDGTGKQMPIGEKREILYQKSNGIYSVQWDSDDWISEDGVIKIIDKLKESDYDGLGYKEHCYIDGVEKLSNFSNDYQDWEGEGHILFSDGFHYHRTLFFKTPIKTELCRTIGVNGLRFGEDHDFAQRLKPHIKNAGYIEDFIYHYIHQSSDFNIRYGFDKQ